MSVASAISIRETRRPSRNSLSAMRSLSLNLCNDPALSAQVRPLKHTLRRVFSCPATTPSIRLRLELGLLPNALFQLFQFQCLAPQRPLTPWCVLLFPATGYETAETARGSATHTPMPLAEQRAQISRTYLTTSRARSAPRRPADDRATAGVPSSRVLERTGLFLRSPRLTLRDSNAASSRHGVGPDIGRMIDDRVAQQPFAGEFSRGA